MNALSGGFCERRKGVGFWVEECFGCLNAVSDDSDVIYLFFFKCVV